jgi:hypothetical protein
MTDAAATGQYPDPDAFIDYLTTQHDAAVEQLEAARRELVHALSLISAIYPAVLCRNSDDTSMYPNATLPEGVTVLYVQTLAGQLAWPIEQTERGLFRHVGNVPPGDHRARWDGHTTEERHRRMNQQRRMLVEPLTHEELTSSQVS